MPGKIICPFCETEFENDSEIICYEVTLSNGGRWVDEERFECPHCSETYNDIKAFYEVEK